MKKNPSTLTTRILLLSVAVLAATGFLLKPASIKADAVTNPFVSLQINGDDLSYAKLYLERNDQIINDDLVLTDSTQNQRTIIGFTLDDSSNIATINRLNVEITYNTYGPTDPWKWFPIETTYSATIRSDMNYKITTDKLSDFAHVIPRVGLVENELSDLDGLASEFDGNLLNDPTKKWYQNRSTTFADSGLLDNEFYVVMPVSHDVKRVWISIDGYTTNGDYVSDGTNGGTFYQDSIGKYIDIPYGMPRLVYFPQDTSIFKLVVSNALKTASDAHVQMDVGAFNSDVQKIVNPYQSFWIGNNGTYDYQADVSQFDEVMFYYIDSEMDIRIYYVSDGIPVYSNITDSDGNLQPEDETPLPCDIICQIQKQLDEVNTFFKKAWSFIQIAGAITIAAVVLFGILWVADKGISIYKNLKKK